MKTDKIIRIRLSTYRRFRKEFKAFPGESVGDYFNRLSKFIEDLNKGDKILIY